MPTPQARFVAARERLDLAAERMRSPPDRATSSRLLRAYFGPRTPPHMLKPELLDEAAAFMERCADELTLREIEESLAANWESETMKLPPLHLVVGE
jgi:hypothetical protein